MCLISIKLLLLEAAPHSMLAFEGQVEFVPIQQNLRANPWIIVSQDGGSREQHLVSMVREHLTAKGQAIGEALFVTAHIRTMHMPGRGAHL